MDIFSSFYFAAKFFYISKGLTLSNKGISFWADVNESFQNYSYEKFYDNGVLRLKGSYLNGNKTDTFFFYSPNGNLVKYEFDFASEMKTVHPKNGFIEYKYTDRSKFYEANVLNNQLSGIVSPEICNQGDYSPSFKNNKLCPPYPECFPWPESVFENQDTSSCP